MHFNSLLVLLFLFLSGSDANAQIRSNKDLLGKWSAASLQLEFFPDGRVIFAMRGGTIPGARYQTDFTRTQPQLSIHIVQKEKKITYRSTIEFISHHSLKVTTLDNDPAHAFDKQRSVILVKAR